MCALMLAFVAGEAAAQPASESGIALAQDHRAKDAEELAMEALARCFAARRGNLSRHWFAVLPGPPDETAVFRRESHSISSGMRGAGRGRHVQRGTLRRPLALVLVERGVSQTPENAPLSSDAQPWFVTPLAALPAGSPVDRGALVVQDFGHCVALRAWRDVRALFSVEPGSSEETAIVERLAPVLGPCLSENADFLVTRRNLRLMLAEPFYQIVTASSAAAGN